MKNMLLLRPIGFSKIDIETLVIFGGNKTILHKICRSWLKIRFPLPDDMVLELTGKHLICSELLVFGWRQAFLGNDWSTGYQALSSALNVYLKCRFHDLAEILFAPHFYALYINHKKWWLVRHPAPRRKCYAKLFWKFN